MEAGVSTLNCLVMEQSTAATAAMKTRRCAVSGQMRVVSFNFEKKVVTRNVNILQILNLNDCVTFQIVVSVPKDISIAITELELA